VQVNEAAIVIPVTTRSRWNPALGDLYFSIAILTSIRPEGWGKATKYDSNFHVLYLMGNKS
jgi:hypothetical protein